MQGFLENLNPKTALFKQFRDNHRVNFKLSESRILLLKSVNEFNRLTSNCGQTIKSVIDSI